MDDEGGGQRHAGGRTVQSASTSATRCRQVVECDVVEPGSHAAGGGAPQDRRRGVECAFGTSAGGADLGHGFADQPLNALPVRSIHHEKAMRPPARVQAPATAASG